MKKIEHKSNILYIIFLSIFLSIKPRHVKIKRDEYDRSFINFKLLFHINK